MPKKGEKVSEETRLRMSAGAKSRPSRLIGRYGLSKEDVEISYSAGEIWCSRCKKFKTREHFNRDRQTRCKECSAELYQMHYAKNKERLLQDRRKYYVDNREQEIYRAKDRSFARYGTDRTWYEETLASQGGCAICGTKAPADGQEFFHVDHNHNCCTKKKTACDKCRRGLLCGRCNTTLERMEVIPNWAANAVSYLRKYGVELA